jgi:5-methylcytosine-specific restriction endonuclease McrA
MKSFARFEIVPPSLRERNRARKGSEALVPDRWSDDWNNADVRGLLRALQGFACWYCGSPIGRVNDRSPPRDQHAVEHIRPKSVYPFLAYRARNYSFACTLCNSKKGDRYPVVGARAAWCETLEARRERLDHEEREWLHPHQDAFEERDFSWSFRPVPAGRLWTSYPWSEGHYWHVCAARPRTVVGQRIDRLFAFFGLNDGELVTARMAEIHELRRNIELVANLSKNPALQRDYVTRASRAMSSFYPHGYALRAWFEAQRATDIAAIFRSAKSAAPPQLQPPSKTVEWALLVGRIDEMLRIYVVDTASDDPTFRRDSHAEVERCAYALAYLYIAPPGDEATRKRLRAWFDKTLSAPVRALAGSKVRALGR